MEKKAKIIYKNNFIYIITDDEIKEGDNVLVGNTIMYCFKINHDSAWLRKPDGNSKLVGIKEYPIIIATTDNSLYIKSNTPLGFSRYISLPQPSQQFIEKYIEEYNKGNIITDVLVEYTKEYNDDGTFSIINNPVIVKDVLKINPKDNTITIKKLKNSWNREEVVELLRKLDNENQYSPEDYTKFDLDNWIKENL